MIGSSITALIVLLRVFARIFVARASKELTVRDDNAKQDEHEDDANSNLNNGGQTRFLSRRESAHARR